MTLSNGKQSAAFVCVCDCGSLKKVLRCDLKRGKIQNCGCLRGTWNKLDIRIGDVFGRLTVLREDSTRTHRGFLCQCRCGSETLVNASPLYNGRTLSCGCLRNETSRKGLKPGEAAFNALYLACQKNAAARKRLFTLSKDQAATLFKGECHYCGLPPSMIRNPPSPLRDPSVNEYYKYNGLDRVNNDEGYIPENTVTCCWTCNRNKHSMAVEVFLNWALSIHARPSGPPLIPVEPNPSVFNRYRKGATVRGLLFTISEKEAWALLACACVYCGTPPSSGPKKKRHSGIDRANNHLGYVRGNCVSSCWPCNRAKGAGTPQEFLTWAARLQHHQIQEESPSGLSV